MKKAVFALGLMSFALTLSAAPRSSNTQREPSLGRCTYSTDSVQTIPEVASTLGLAAFAFAALGVASMAWKPNR